MPRYAHIIWDWNGTLLDDTWLCLEAFNALLRARGLPETTLERHRDEFEFPAERYYKRMGFDPSPESFAQSARAFIDIYERRRLECALHAGTMDTIKTLAKAGCQMSVFSAYKEDTLNELLAHYELVPYFRAVTGQTHINGSGKLDRAQLHREKILGDGGPWLMVGDSPHDHEVAQALGADCALLSHGHFPEHRLAPLGAPVYDSLGGLLDAMLS